MPTGAPPYADLIASLLLEAGAVRVSTEKPFTLTSGNLSPVYFDCRRLISHPAAMTVIAGLFQWVIEQEQIPVDVVAGGESAGIPFADRLATVMGRPMVYVRKQPRGHGTGSAIEGQVGSSAHAVLIEDLITDGGSKLVFVQGLRDAGAVVEHCLVVLDREQGGAAPLAEEGVRLWPLATAAQTLQYALDARVVCESDYRAAMLYLRNPDDWRPGNESKTEVL